MNKLNAERRTQVVHALCEGNSIRATARMTGVAINTVVKLLQDVGQACLEYQNEHMVNLPCKRLEADEIWSFVYSKQKNVPSERKGEFGVGDVWTWTAIDADSKLIPCWYVGTRDASDGFAFMTNLAKRLRNRVQLTTDGHAAYLQAVEGAFGSEIDYAMLVKLYGAPSQADQRRYSPARVYACFDHKVTGNPDPALVSTSYVERANLTMRMHMRRFTRLTNAFSKKLENHMHALALHFMYYNYAKPHKTLSKPYATTPAMASGLTDHVWKVSEIVALLERSN